MGDNGYTLIFNKNWNIWGTMYDQNKDKDVIQVKVNPTTSPDSVERLIYHIDPSGKVTMQWGTMVISFNVK